MLRPSTPFRLLTDAFLAELCLQPALEYVDLTSLTLVTEKALIGEIRRYSSVFIVIHPCSSADFIRNCGAELRIFYLSFCSGVTSETATAIGQVCVNMRKLYLSRQPLIGDKVCALVFRNTPLSQIAQDVIAICQGCSQVTPQLLAAFSLLTVSDGSWKCST